MKAPIIFISSFIWVRFKFMVMKINYHLDHFQAAVDSISQACSGPMNFTIESIVIAACCLLGLIWAVINMLSVSKINVEEGYTGYDESDD